MGRELRRKQAKREGKSLKNEEVKDEYRTSNIIKLVVIIVLSLGIVYLLSALFLTKELDWFNKKEDTTETETVKNSILAKSIFNQSEEEYYVYFYSFKEEDSDIASIVSSKLSDSKVYRVNTDSAMNANYVSDVSNKNAKSLEDLKVKQNTIVKISNGTIIKYYEEDEIKNNL